MNIKRGAQTALTLLVFAITVPTLLGACIFVATKVFTPPREFDEHKAKCESKGGVFIQAQADEYCLKAEALMEFSE